MKRCPDCEALLIDVDCLDCHIQRVHAEWVANLEVKLATTPLKWKTHCPTGHEMTEANTRIVVRAGARPSIYRQCRTCAKLKDAVYKAKLRQQRSKP